MMIKETIKQFLKLDRRKIFIVIIFFLLLISIYALAILTQERSLFFGLLWFLFVSLNYPIDRVIYSFYESIGITSPSFLLDLIIHLPIWIIGFYLISCLIVLIYDKFKSKM